MLQKLLNLSKTNNNYFIIILIIAVLLRFIGIYPGYPPIHADEGITHSQGLAMILEMSLNPKHGYGLPYNYPILVPLINALFYLFLFIPLTITWITISKFTSIYNIVNTYGFKEVIFGHDNINTVYWGRFTTAFFGVGIVILIYFFSKKLFKNKNIALISSFLSAINYRLVLNSHFGLPDIYNSFFLILSLFLTLSLWENKTKKYYVISALGVSLYFSTKFQPFSAVPYFIVLSLLFIKEKNIKKVIFSISTLFLSAVFLNYFHLIHLKETLSEVSYSALKYQAGSYKLNIFSYSYLYHIGLGKVTSILVLFGVFTMLIKKPFQFFYLFSVVVLFMFVMTYYSQAGFYTRNFVTIIPLILIFPSFFLNYLFHSYQNQKIFFKVIPIFLLILVFVESLRNSIYVPIEYSHKWNQTNAYNWVAKNIPSSSNIAAHPSTKLPGNLINIIYKQGPSDYFLQELQDENIDYAILNLDWVNTPYYWWMNSNNIKFWNKPNNILTNTPIAEMVRELSGFEVYESLNSWQAPDSNFLVVKIPEKQKFKITKNILEDNINNTNFWEITNDGYGNTKNFSFDENNGYLKNGSLKISISGEGIYSQRFVSKPINIENKKDYLIRAFLKASGNINSPSGPFLGVNIYSSNDKLLLTKLSSRVKIENEWQEKNITFTLPENAKYIKIFFQTENFTDQISWLDDLSISEIKYQNNQSLSSQYIKSNLKLEDHLFPNSHGGL